MGSIADNLRQVQAQVAQLTLQSGRQPDAVQLIAVSKTQPIAAIEQAMQAGHYIFGENRPQELATKAQALPDAEWHLIGQLQTNKVKLIIPHVVLIHSLDSLRLLHEIEKQAEKHERTVGCLIQINISGEDSKSGTDQAGAHAIVQACQNECAHVSIKGLMGIAALTDDQGLIQAQFRSLRVLRDALASQYDSDRIALSHLSMGMSSDYALAIAEGATLVRVGSAIFGSR